jgi:hypothetical protein
MKTYPLFAFSSLMTCTGQQLFVFMFSHFFSSFFDNTAQKITPYQKNSVPTNSWAFHPMNFEVAIYKRFIYIIYYFLST